MRSVSFDQGKLLAEYGPNESRFRIDATLSGEELRGDINGGRLSMEIRLSRARPLDRPYVVEPITFTSGDISLAGKLYRPRGGGRHPAVAIVPGFSTGVVGCTGKRGRGQGASPGRGHGVVEEGAREGQEPDGP